MILIIGFTCPATIHFKFITKCDSLLYYKVRQVLESMMILLQSATVITEDRAATGLFSLSPVVCLTSELSAVHLKRQFLNSEVQNNYVFCPRVSYRAVLLLFFALVRAFAFFPFFAKTTLLVLRIFTSNSSLHFAEFSGMKLKIISAR